MPNKSALGRVMSRVEVRGPNECWPWTGRLREGAYPDIWVGEQEARRLGLKQRAGSVIVSRYLAALRDGGLPRDRVVMHECDDTRCCNPSHLRAATQHENVLDARAKGRLPSTEARRASALRSVRRGEAHPRARWSDALVAELRDRHRGGESISFLAALLRAPVATVRDAVSGRTYRHVAGGRRRPL